MFGYQVKQQIISVGARDYAIESLLDRQQFFDPDGVALRRGISEASWSFFGMLWPAGVALAEAMVDVDAGDRRVLEVGCGLALAGIVAHGRDLDITVSDHHPLGERFLLRNLELNAMRPLPFLDISWAEPNPTLGRFDLVIGSDLLYERGHPDELATFLDAHTSPGADVMIVDPGRRRGGELSRRMAARGFECTPSTSANLDRCRLFRYRQR